MRVFSECRPKSCIFLHSPPRSWQCWKVAESSSIDCIVETDAGIEGFLSGYADVLVRHETSIVRLRWPRRIIGLSEQT